ncbi:hypothetical protein V1281_000856 [Nitrobacteraceae bacterium AZCC 2161]|jgi:hypothetical protein
MISKARRIWVWNAAPAEVTPKAAPLRLDQRDIEI